MGTTALNMHERIDGLLYALVHPQKPMVTTRVLDLVHFDQVGSPAARAPRLSSGCTDQEQTRGTSRSRPPAAPQGWSPLRA